ncbi:hypothetical protein BJ165DRAFT_1535576 [Panaeolus papilionaceus]|nr:hypothetical protein BJ165DRAFT_1535576 [Panaeolus papilionaceus]
MTSSRHTTKEKRRVQRRDYYRNNLDQERQRARQRADNKREHEDSTQADLRRARHRVNQAQYREKNRLALNVKAWQYQRDKKWHEARLRDEQEYQEWIAQGGNLHDLESIA